MQLATTFITLLLSPAPTTDTPATEPAPADTLSPPPPPRLSPERIEAIEARLGSLEKSNEALTKANEDLRDENEELREELEYVQDDVEYASEEINRIKPYTQRVSGYVDTGFFYVGGDGSGILTDLGFNYFPEYDGLVPDSWVFMGDPLSTAINSRGEPAETSESRAVVFDSVSNGGKASFITNALNIEYFGSAGARFTVHGMVDLMPRNRDVSDPDGVQLGDFIDVKHAYMKYAVPTKRVKMDISVGKFDPVVGREYRIQESPDRISVTPSLICRYLCGRTTGLKVRTKFVDDSLVLNLSVTNGGAFWEGFGFQNDVDVNHMKTFSGRLSYKLPLKGDVEFGVSGLYGAQDLQDSDSTTHWQASGDVHVFWAGVDFTAEFVQGNIDGRTEAGEPECNLNACLEFRGAYGLLGYHATNWLMPYVRSDWRDAVHLQGGSFVYISELVRVTGGLRFDIGTNLILKAEYTYNRELGNIPQFANDTFTSSAIAKF